MTTATEKQEEVQAEPNPYNKKKHWDNSNPKADRGFQSADDSLAYKVERKTAVISSRVSLRLPKLPMKMILM
mgnify:CR=1 FL=1